MCYTHFSGRAHLDLFMAQLSDSGKSKNALSRDATVTSQKIPERIGHSKYNKVATKLYLFQKEHENINKTHERKENGHCNQEWIQKSSTRQIRFTQRDSFN